MSTGTGPVASRDGPPPRVLVVDDHDDARRLFAIYLSTAGFDVDESSNGQDALRLARSNGYALILMDLRMPAMSGYEAIAHLRTAGVRSKILAITADAFPTARVRAMATGADAYVSKPISRSDLLAACERMLARTTA